MTWIKDVIYGLKQEYGDIAMNGDGIVIEHRYNSSMNRDTGLQSFNLITEYVPQGIALPLNLRRQFLRQVGIHREALLEKGDQEFLFDKDDLQYPIKDGDYLIWSNKRLKIKNIDDYPDAYVVIGNHEVGPSIFAMALADRLELTDNHVQS